MGPVTPLLAVVEAWRKAFPQDEFVWIGTRSGPERAAVEAAGIRFLHVPVFRLTRYPSVEWLTLPFAFVGSFLVAWFTLGRERPDMIASAGGYTAVPVVLCGWARGIPSWVHQQDARVVLTNRVCAPFAKCVTTAWEHLLSVLPPTKSKWIGNPVRPSVLEGKRDVAHERLGIDLRYPTVLAFGGGGGASWINRLMEEIGATIAEQANVIHITGRGKRADRLETIHKRYHAVEFLTDDMAHALKASTLVVARAGMGTLTELAALAKPAILIPIPGSMQEDNIARVRVADAAVVLAQDATGTGELKRAILELLADAARQKRLGTNLRRVLPTDVAEEMTRHVRAHCLK